MEASSPDRVRWNRLLRAAAVSMAAAAAGATAADANPSGDRRPSIDVPAIAAHAKASVVHVRARDPGFGERASSLAVLVAGDLAVTTLHAVARRADSGKSKAFGNIEVRISDRESIPARVIAMDERRDVALLRLEQNAPTGTGLLLADTKPAIGELLVVLGSGEVDPLVVSVAGLDRGATASGLVRTTGRFTPRFWGGPVLNASGALVGIAVCGGNGGAAVSVPFLRTLYAAASERPASLR